MPTDVLIDQKEYKRVLRLMGNRFEILVVHSDEHEAELCIDGAVAEIQRIEALLTTFNEKSQTSEINKNAGVRPVKVDREVFDLVKRSVRISELTQGAFDISYGSVDKKFWNFDVAMKELPDPELARESVKLINYRDIELDEEESMVFLRNKGMRIGFGGIGKGYAAEQAKRLLKQSSVAAGIVNAAGDLAAWGLQPDGRPWSIGIADPRQKHQPFSSIEINDMAVATSGNYEKYAVINGKRYSHTIDPRTGYPISGINSVTVICTNAEIADALATPVMIMGVKAGLYMINQMKGIACIIVDERNNIYTSKNINLR
jgi:FAD:protein FMN transferase